MYVGVALKIFVTGFHALLSLDPSSLFILAGCHFISTAYLTSRSMYPDALASTSVSWNPSGGLIQCCALPLRISPADKNANVIPVLFALFLWIDVSAIRVPNFFHFLKEYYGPLRLSVLRQHLSLIFSIVRTLSRDVDCLSTFIKISQ